MNATPSTFVVVEREHRLADPGVPDMRVLRVAPEQVRVQPSVIPTTRSVVMVAAEVVEEMLALWPTLPADRRVRPFLFVVPADRPFLAAHLLEMGAVVVREGQDLLANGIAAVLARAFGAGVRSGEIAEEREPFPGKAGDGPEDP
ncbi:MAG TPA: hypothetical protein VFA79_15895 [Myxococcales bacterium]|nr:hypothetical protein [Myxococcales bacterium]